MKYITIASDISNDSRLKISTWACYIRHSGGVIKQSGEFKEFHKNTALAETYALINALVIAKTNIPSWKESKVIIYNEIEYVLDPCRTKAGNIRKRDSARAEIIQNLAMPILQEAADWERRKVKAHFKGWKESSTPARYALNRWCDQEAGRLLKELRRKKRKSLRF